MKNHLRVLVTEVENPLPIGLGDQRFEAWLDLYWWDARKRSQMGELITTGLTRLEAIENMIGFARTLGYDGVLYFLEGDDAEICDVDCAGEKPHVRLKATA